MKKFKLLKPLPGAEPGEIFVQDKYLEHETKVIRFRRDFCIKEWFEEIKEGTPC